MLSQVSGAYCGFVAPHKLLPCLPPGVSDLVCVVWGLPLVTASQIVYILV